jgi:hypothetical protein
VNVSALIDGFEQVWERENDMCLIDKDGKVTEPCETSVASELAKGFRQPNEARS